MSLQRQHFLLSCSKTLSVGLATFQLANSCSADQCSPNWANHTVARAALEQRAKKVVSDSPGLVDFAIRLVNSVTNLPDGQVIFFKEFK